MSLIFVAWIVDDIVDDTDTRMLFVLAAKSAVVRTAMFGFGERVSWQFGR